MLRVESALVCLGEALFLCTDHGLERLVQAYRAHGHKAAKINPLLPEKPVADSVPEITSLGSIVKGRLNTSGKPDNAARCFLALVLCRWFVFFRVNRRALGDKPNEFLS